MAGANSGSEKDVLKCNDLILNLIVGLTLMSLLVPIASCLLKHSVIFGLLDENHKRTFG